MKHEYPAQTVSSYRTFLRLEQIEQLKFGFEVNGAQKENYRILQDTGYHYEVIQDGETFSQVFNRLTNDDQCFYLFWEMLEFSKRNLYVFFVPLEILIMMCE